MSNVPKTILDADPEEDDFYEYIGYILKGLKEYDSLGVNDQTEANEIVFGYESSRFHFEQMVRLFFDNVGKGSFDKIREAITEIPNVLRKNTNTYYILEDLPEEVQCTIRFRVLSQIMALFLRSDNMGKAMGWVVGCRRKKWRDVLLRIRANILVDHFNSTVFGFIDRGIFDSIDEARDVLSKMKNAGLIEEYEKEKYTLSQVGTGVCLILLKNDNGETILNTYEEGSILDLQCLLKKSKLKGDELRRSYLAENERGNKWQIRAEKAEEEVKELKRLLEVALPHVLSECRLAFLENQHHDYIEELDDLISKIDSKVK